jgi:cytidylate kinase
VSGPAPVPVVAIDGPSASGKGTVAEFVAKELGFHYLDSGALYRLVALGALRGAVALEDEAAVTAIARGLDARFESGQIWLSGDRVTDAIRTEECSRASSRVAAMPGVRRALLERQRGFREAPGLVAEGRDMASVVFPDARLKVFLTASPESRAQRRYKQLMDKGIAATLPGLLQDLRERDARDASRSVAPLKQGPDARLLDTTAMSAAQAAARIVGWYREAEGAGENP